MSQPFPPDFCPYKGLQPYTEQDRAFFFGRRRDQQIIISNLYAAQLTVFYGASGVGKSSVLLAGAVPLLKQEPNLTVVVFRSWQEPNFVSQLKKCTLEAVNERLGKPLDADVSLPLDDFLAQVTRGSRGSIFFVLDQFEEYFLYNPPSPGADAFEAEFARTINRRDLNVNFLLSLREDGLSKLDRFQGRIPTLMNNMLRLEHLDRDGAKDAITRPLDEYNRRLSNGQGAVTIEPELVESVLDDLRGVKVASEQTGEGTVEHMPLTAAAVEIETPLLQMVLTRLWEEERAAGSQVLRLKTFIALGRAENIARTHLDTIMGRLTASERDQAANILRYMVTPSGAKIAQEAGALASWTEQPEPQVQAILTRLSSADMRILRTMQAPGELMRYEIFHDVLAQAILNWRRRYVATQQEEKIRREEQARREAEQEEAQRRSELERSRRLRKTISGLLVALSIMGALLGFALWEWHQATRQSKRADQAKADADDKSKKVEAIGHINLGHLYLQKKNFARALQEYEEAIKLDPSNQTAYSAKGYVQIRVGDKTGQYDDAITTLEYLTSKVDPSFTLGHYNLALAYSKKGKSKEAVKEAVTVLKSDIDFCRTFKDDPAYKWLLITEEYKTLCRGHETAP
ncbi:MAG TPA: tetratricopeptide repeat protein [Pyrinomonadaceae bacterium]|nr:tetratricopeptide repeat protein [Pyrinomonadaceae bacterium]